MAGSMGASYVEAAAPLSGYDSSSNSYDCVYTAGAAATDQLAVVIGQLNPTAGFSTAETDALMTVFSTTSTKQSLSGLGDAAEFARGTLVGGSGTGSLLLVQKGSNEISVVAQAPGTLTQLEGVAKAVIRVDF